MGIRNAAKAIILKDNKISLNKNKNSLGNMFQNLPSGTIYYDLPGGGQNQYETLEEAVVRECLEETGYSVSVDRLAAIFEEISTNDEFRKSYEQYAHKVHFIFLCHLSNEKAAAAATEKDLDMLESEWIDVEMLQTVQLFPKIININFDLIINSKQILYLGSQRIK